MKTTELIELLKQGVKPTVKFNKRIEVLECDLESGMKGVLTNIVKDNVPEVYIMIFNLLPFKSYNENLMTANYYDKNGVPCQTWKQQTYYTDKELESYKVYVMDYDDVCDIDSNKIFERYLTENSNLTYVEWLESQIGE